MSGTKTISRVGRDWCVDAGILLKVRTMFVYYLGEFSPKDVKKKRKGLFITIEPPSDLVTLATVKTALQGGIQCYLDYSRQVRKDQPCVQY